MTSIEYQWAIAFEVANSFLETYSESHAFFTG